MLKWFLSPEGEKLEVNEVLEKGLLSHRYPMPYLKMCASQREWKGVASTTQLLNGTRLEYLKILTPYAMDPDNMAFMLLGTRAHSRLENLTPKQSFAELKIPMPEDEITGIADLLEQQPNGEWWLTDYKTWGSYKGSLVLGVEKKTRTMLDDDGNPVLYKRSGRGYNAGDIRLETYYELNPEKAEMEEVKLQLNRYRMSIEKYFDIEISRLKVFACIRDGGLQVASTRGIEKNTYYIDIPIMDNQEVDDFFLPKRDALINSVNGYNWSEEVDKEMLIKNAPPECNENESWDGRRCKAYCPVAEVCKEIGCKWLEEDA